MMLLIRPLVSLILFLSRLLLWLLDAVRAVLFFRRSSKPRRLMTTAASAGYEWQITLFLLYICLLGVALLLLPRACQAAPFYLRRLVDLRLVCWPYLSVWSMMLIPRRWRPDDGLDRPRPHRHPQLPQNLPRRFSIRELKAATSGFSESKRLGSGSFGVVYEAALPNGCMIAVKKLNPSGSTSERQFENEARLLQLRHRNIVRLLGYCCDGQHRLLCYEHMPKGSLDMFLFGKFPTLNWAARHKIIKGICCGLRYLHEECENKTLHLDIKPSNILLDNAMNPKISDFGLSRLFDMGSTQMSSKFYAPVGYSPPEYVYSGRPSTKTDIFGFGILLLEIATDQHNKSFNRSPKKDEFIEYAMRLVSKNRSNRLPPPEYVQNDCLTQFTSCIKIGLMCVSMDEKGRPSAGDIMDKLNGRK